MWLGLGAVVVLLGTVAVALSLQPDAPGATGTASSATSEAAAPTPSAMASSSDPAVPDGMVLIPAGSYSAGCDADGGGVKCYPDEGPRRAVTLERPVAIDVHEVTVAAYAACVAASACPPAGQGTGCNSKRPGLERHPINCVTWAAADAYCRHRGGRLPSELEWEMAARGIGGVVHPWGDDPPTCARVVMHDGKQPGCGAAGTAATGSQPADRSAIGAFDLGGNVREWTADDYGALPGGNTVAGRSGKINRGGSFVMRVEEMAAAFTRGVDKPAIERPDLGFRCASDP